MKPKLRSIWSLPIILSFATLLVFLVQTSSLRAATANNPSGSEFIYLPLAAKAESCDVPNPNFGSIPIASAPTNLPAADHPDINLAIRGYEQVSAALTLVDYAGNTDPNAPQLDTLFTTPRLANFTNAYQIYRWDWSCGCQLELMSSWDTTLLGLETNPGELIHVPDSGYDIGGGNDVMVLYAAENRITLKYTREDNVVGGYTIHLEDVCVDPTLLALYESLNAAGRGELPALPGGQALGRALGSQIKVSVRDAGNFLDARSRKDWWQDY